MRPPRVPVFWIAAVAAAPLLAALAPHPGAFGQEGAEPPAAEDGKVRLLSAESAQLVEKDGENLRKVVGEARFLHNGTYLLCDSALWNTRTNIIDATGSVRIIQGKTRLESGTLKYLIDENLAQFRGELVQLDDGDADTLRTQYLDYNTLDSVAVFQDGGAMRDKDGQIMESLDGSYDAKARVFVFEREVDMYLDTTFVRTTRLTYDSDASTAHFGAGTDMWQDDKMLSADGGWYDRGRELFFFHGNVHLLTRDQEAWSDTLYYFRDVNNADMQGHVELMDTTRNVFAVAGRMEYADSSSRIRMTREAAVMSVSEERSAGGGRFQRDTLYLGADTLIHRSVPGGKVCVEDRKAAKGRKQEIAGDPIMQYRREAAEKARKEAEKKEEELRKQGLRAPGAARQGAPGMPMPPGVGPGKGSTPPGPFPADSLAHAGDSLSLAGLVPAGDSLAHGGDSLSHAGLSSAGDSLAHAGDSLKTPEFPPLPDSLRVGFIRGHAHVRLFRRDIQMVADSLEYNDLDSLVRLYRSPIFFSEGTRQYASDSMYLVVMGQRLERAHLLSNAFITMQEDSIHFDQVRGAEMVAHFDSSAALVRFDALGGASSLFYLEENGALATVNKVDAKMIYATFRDGEIDRMHYYENPKNDGYPTVMLPAGERKLKGFLWSPELRPTSPRDVTSLVPRKSLRSSYLARPHTRFVRCRQYFPGQVNQVYRDIAMRDSLQVARERARSLAAVAADSAAQSRAVADTLGALADSVALAGGDGAALSQGADSTLHMADTLHAADTVHGADTLAPAAAPSPRQLRARERARRREEKLKARDAEHQRKLQAAQERKAARERERKLRILRKLARREQRERQLYLQYLEKYRTQ